jgi:hypothetical protein
MSTDGYRLHYTYGIAVLCLLGGGLLVFMKLGEIPAEALLALITFVFGLVLGFVFNRESSASQARATERAVAQGAIGGAAVVEAKDKK